MKEKGYGLFTTIAMIIGVVIGSGIFFKSDNILVATNGSIALGVLVFCSNNIWKFNYFRISSKKLRSRRINSICRAII